MSHFTAFNKIEMRLYYSEFSQFWQENSNKTFLLIFKHSDSFYLRDFEVLQKVMLDLLTMMEKQKLLWWF